MPQKFYVLGELVKLLVGNQRINCDVNSYAAQMCKLDGLNHVFARKIFSVGSRTKFFAR